MASMQSLRISQGEVADHPDVAVAQRQIMELLAINAKLVRQLDVLKRREAHALRMADRDALTGLVNRRKMLEHLDIALHDASQHGHCVGLLFIDLDDFKHVNDRHGHALGDQLLVSVATRLGARARVGDVVCRYGGDEFVILLPRVAGLTCAQRVGASLSRRLSVPHCLGELDLTVTAAIGAAVYPDAPDAVQLLAEADASMYRAKTGSRVFRREALFTPQRRRGD